MLEQAYGTYRQLLKEGRRVEAQEFFDDNREKIGRYKSVEAIKRAEAQINEAIRMIERNKTMSPDVKRERIQRLQESKTRVAKSLAPK